MNISLEPIREADFEELNSLFLEFATFEKLPEKMINSVEKMKKEKAYFHGFIARDENNEVMGYTNYFFAYYTWTGKSLYMDDLYVREKYRAKGVGTALIKKVISFAREEGCNGVRWQVSNWNESAIRFYENLGAEMNKVEMNCDIVF